MAKSKISEWATPFGLFALIIGIATFVAKWKYPVGQRPPLISTKENFVSKKCPDGTRSDGPCLMEFPGF
jgi:hypothetical protein